jgi:hypothetical protein
MRIALATLFIAMTGVSAIAQDASPPRPPSFPVLFPNPTGKNGYEEIILATDELRLFPEVDTVTQKGTTLADKKRIISDARSQKALRLLRIGVQKPLALPQREMNFQTQLPELAGFRRLGRLLATDMYVQLANGQVNDAINELELGFKLAFVSKRGTMIHELVGNAINSIVLNRFAGQLNQMSARDCDRILKIVKDWLAIADPTAETLAGERDVVLKELANATQSPDRLEKFLTGTFAGGDEAQEKQIEGIKQQVKSDPNLMRTILEDASKHLRSAYDHAIAQASLPPSQRDAKEADIAPTSYGAALAGFLLPAQNQFLAATAKGRVQLQILGVHAAILRYKWEHEELPASLDVLKIGELALDAFTGQPFEYKRDGDRYTLSSAGPVGADRPIRLGAQP